MFYLVVVGIVHSSGDYNGQKYDNYNLHCLSDGDENKEQHGQICEVVKVSAKIFNDLVGIDVGSVIRPLYDKYGRVIDIDVK